MQKYLGMLALVEDQGQGGKIKLGVITSLDPTGGLARLSFGDRSISNYSSDQVMVLKEKNLLYAQLLNDVKAISIVDFKMLLSVNMLQEKNTLSSTLEIMELLKTNPSAAKMATVSLSTQLPLSAAHSLDQEGISAERMVR